MGIDFARRIKVNINGATDINETKTDRNQKHPRLPTTGKIGTETYAIGGNLTS